MRMPDSSGVDAIEGWEQGFFQSEFTHAYGAARLTSFPGGFLALCHRLAGSRKPFPTEYLTDARETLHQFVSAYKVEPRERRREARCVRRFDA